MRGPQLSWAVVVVVVVGAGQAGRGLDGFGTSWRSAGRRVLSALTSERETSQADGGNTGAGSWEFSPVGREDLTVLQMFCGLPIGMFGLI